MQNKKNPYDKLRTHFSNYASSLIILCSTEFSYFLILSISLLVLQKSKIWIPQNVSVNFLINFFIRCNITFFHMSLSLFPNFLFFQNNAPVESISHLNQTIIWGQYLTILKDFCVMEKLRSRALVGLPLHFSWAYVIESFPTTPK